MTATTNPPTGPVDTWGEVIALLVQAADRGYQDSTTDPAVHSTALAAHGLAAAAIALLAPDLQDRLDEVVLEPATVSMTPVELIRAADAAAQRHPIQQLPTGAREVIVALRDLIGQTHS